MTPCCYSRHITRRRLSSVPEPSLPAAAHFGRVLLLLRVLLGASQEAAGARVAVCCGVVTPACTAQKKRARRGWVADADGRTLTRNGLCVHAAVRTYASRHSPAAADGSAASLAGCWWSLVKDAPFAHCCCTPAADALLLNGAVWYGTPILYTYSWSATHYTSLELTRWSHFTDFSRPVPIAACHNLNHAPINTMGGDAATVGR